MILPFLEYPFVVTTNHTQNAYFTVHPLNNSFHSSSSSSLMFLFCFGNEELYNKLESFTQFLSFKIVSVPLYLNLLGYLSED